MTRIRILAIVLVITSPLLAAEFSGSVRVRAEGWRWFETAGFDDRYTFFGALARASMAHRFTPLADAQIELAAPVLLGLPEDAVAPAPRGQLGFGGTYFAANDGDSNAANVFVKQAWARFGTERLALRAGRFELIDGAEVTPKDPLLAGVKRTRVAHRLLGNFGFTHVGRSLDGLQLTSSPNATWQITGVLGRPTAGAFTVEGGGGIEDVGLLYVAGTRSDAASDLRLFAIAYADRRELVKTDNRPAPVRNADREDIEISTIGAHYLRVMPVRTGKIDMMFWGVVQGGTWGALDHRVGALAAEVGWHRGAVSVRGGVYSGSGDDDPTDDEHETFFQMLPTPRVYARFPFYNAMNSRDAFVAASWKVRKWTLNGELHRLRLDSERDLWYSGGGAFDDGAFGFAGRPSNGHSDLAGVVDLNADYALNPKTTISAYAAIARGGDVVSAIFDGRTGSLVYAEVTRRF